MARRRSKARRSQIIFWVVSVLVVLSMAIGMAISFTPRSRRVTPSPVPSITPFPTRTATPGPG